MQESEKQAGSFPAAVAPSYPGSLAFSKHHQLTCVAAQTQQFEVDGSQTGPLLAGGRLGASVYHRAIRVLHEEHDRPRPPGCAHLH